MNEKEQNQVSEICSKFQMDGVFKTADILGNGRINVTYAALHTIDSTEQRYVVQKINRHVFKDPDRLMDNFDRVTKHIHDKLKRNGNEEIHRRSLSLIPTFGSHTFHVDESGEYWRAFNFIENAQTYFFASNPKHTFEAAKALSFFQYQLSDYPPEELHEVIPGFHDTPRRFETFTRAIDNDIVDRAELVGPEIEFAMKRESMVSVLLEGQKSGDYRERVVHNDTKMSNVMIDDETLEGICVIDLDTVGPGLPQYDFGDLVRTATCPVSEGETDLSKIHVQMDMFEAAAEGYLTHARRFLNETEIGGLTASCKLLAYETGMRFLTDFLEGDVYFKGTKQNENLDRCRCQFKLVESFEHHENEMYRYIKNL